VIARIFEFLSISDLLLKTEILYEQQTHPHPVKLYLGNELQPGFLGMGEVFFLSGAGGLVDLVKFALGVGPLNKQ